MEVDGISVWCRRLHCLEVLVKTASSVPRNRDLRHVRSHEVVALGNVVGLWPWNLGFRAQSCRFDVNWLLNDAHCLIRLSEPWIVIAWSRV